MSRGATVELDFFGIERSETSSKPCFQAKFLNRQRSFRDIQSAISKINPELLKYLIASGSANNQQIPENSSLFDSKKTFSVPSTPKEEPTPFTSLPFCSPLPRPSFENPPQTAPLTIFYNGTVAVFDVLKDKAETILKLAENGISKSGESNNQQPQRQLLENLDGDLPIARRKSLQRFLEKRKERLSTVSPYDWKSDSRI